MYTYIHTYIHTLYVRRGCTLKGEMNRTKGPTTRTYLLEEYDELDGRKIKVINRETKIRSHVM